MCMAVPWGAAQPSPDEEGGGGAEAAVTFVFWLSSVWSKSCLGIVGLFLGSLGSVWSHYLARASRSPHPLRWSRDHPVPFPQEMPSSQPPQHPHLKSPSWYFPNACRMMVTIAMRGFTMQN